MNSIIYDNEMIIPEYNKWEYYNEKLNRLNKKDSVKFALFCGKIVNNNRKESNDCIELVEKWLIDQNAVNIEELSAAANAASAVASYTASYTAGTAYAAAYSITTDAYAASSAAYTITSILYAVTNVINTDTAKNDIINKYLQILLRKTKQFQNNKILEQISKVDVDRLELVDWNMITDIMLEEYNIVNEFEYKDIFSRRCLIELLRREYV